MEIGNTVKEGGWVQFRIPIMISTRITLDRVKTPRHIIMFIRINLRGGVEESINNRLWK